MAPNAFVLDWVKKHYLDRLRSYLSDLSLSDSVTVSLEIGSAPRSPAIETGIPSRPNQDGRNHLTTEREVVVAYNEKKAPVALEAGVLLLDR